jgi:hypothetical protein
MKWLLILYVINADSPTLPGFYPSAMVSKQAYDDLTSCEARAQFLHQAYSYGVHSLT